MKRTRIRIKWNIVERNMLIMLNLATLGLVINTIATKGTSFFSTIGYFG